MEVFLGGRLTALPAMTTVVDMDDATLEAEILRFLADVTTVSRVELAEMLGVRDDLRFRLVWNKARNASAAAGRDFRPLKGGRYELAAPEQTMARAGRDRRAALKKLERGAAKVDAIPDEAVPEEARASLQRARAKGRQMVAVQAALMRRRTFDVQPTVRPANPRVVTTVTITEEDQPATQPVFVVRQSGD